MIALALLLAAAIPDGASYILLDARSGETIASRWENPESPAPLGSLVKPFLALAYGASHGYRYPEFVCTGRNCWYTPGHGRLRLPDAIANSCNEWFEQLAAPVTLGDLRPVLERFGLNDPSPGASLIGRGALWLNSPGAMARAYVELLRSKGQPGVDEVLRGMEMAAKSGTGHGIGLPVLVKTGTAPCSHAKHGAGDGFVIAADPGRYVLLAGRHNATGAETAAAAGAILRALR